MALLETDSLVKRYGNKQVVNGVSVKVEPGEVVGLLGPNGAGKTTTINIMTSHRTTYSVPDGCDV